MADHRTPQISPRKLPKQKRSTELVAAILEAATKVLAKEGAQRFTTARVADRAGVSVGSLYQYFPNKAAILLRLQSDEWKQTTELIASILQDAGTPPIERLRALVHAFIRSECDEAAIRSALNDAAPLYRDAPEAQATKALGDSIFQAFVQEILPDAPKRMRTVAADMITRTMTVVGEDFSQCQRTSAEITTYADAMADMFCAYLTELARNESAKT
ncbi:TetR family transcriptional regulator [Mycolicibacterium sp. A43C]